MRVTTFLTTMVLACVSGSFALPQETCMEYLMAGCAGDPAQYDCVQVTTALSRLKGGESSDVLQEYCFQIGSPLVQGLMIDADQGTLRLGDLEEGDTVGEMRFDVLLSDFGEDCPLGDEAYMYAPITVVTEGDDEVEIQVVIIEASDPMKDCLLQYDPTDEEHNFGFYLEGTLANVNGGGFVMSLQQAELGEFAVHPGLDTGDLTATASPAPVFFEPITKEDLFVLPPGGGELIVLTEMSATNEFLEPVVVEFEEFFDIEAGSGGPQFVRGDANADSRIDLSDAVAILNYLFLGGVAPPCFKSADVDDNGILELTDAVRDLNFLFTGGPAPSSPFPGCGLDPTPDDQLACDAYEHCP